MPDQRFVNSTLSPKVLATLPNLSLIATRSSGANPLTSSATQYLPRLVCADIMEVPNDILSLQR